MLFLPDGILHNEDWACVWVTHHAATNSHTVITRYGLKK